MPLTRGTIIFICLVACSLRSQGQTVYRNRNYGFSVTQPKGWSRYEPFDKNGVLFTPPGVNASHAEITVGGGVNQPSEISPETSQTADEIINSLPETLRESSHATKLSVLRKDYIAFAGMKGRLIEARYTDDQTGRERYVIEAVAIHPSEAVYSVALECEASEASRLETTFEGVAKSLTVRKNPRR